MRDSKPLYREVNSRTHGVHHGGGDYRHSRHVKKQDAARVGSMHAGQRHGRDYTPLFQFLLSKVGQDWSNVYSHAVARLDRPEPIFWMVAIHEADRKPTIRIGENSFYSGLYVDADGKLAMVAPDLKIEDMTPGCSCCTHTFNGVPFTKAYEPL